MVGIIRNWRILPTSRYAEVILLIAMSVIVLWWRRPDQFSHAALWAEEGPHILLPYAIRGWESLFQPVAGYVILISKLIAFSSYSLSILHTPQIALWLTVAFTALVVLSIRFSPTELPCKTLCALAVLFIPTDSEVFGTVDRSFWWAGIWLILALLWRREAQHQIIRLFMLIIGGLSSPLIVPFSLLYVFNAWQEKRKSEWTVALVAVAIALLQGAIMVSTDADIGKRSIEWLAPYYLAGKFFGNFLYWPLTGTARNVVGVLFAIILAGVTFHHRKKLDRHFFMLVAIFAVVGLSTVMRVDEYMIQAMKEGPRYLFYPYILLLWIMIWLGRVSSKTGRALLGLVMAFSIVQAMPKYARHHTFIDWEGEVRQCANTQERLLPFHTNGKADEIWLINFQGAYCARLIDESIF